MPNGQTDIFKIPRKALIAMLETQEEFSFRGFKLADRAQRKYPVAGLIRILKGHPSELIQIEEQHGRQFVLHIGETWEYWVEVDPGVTLHSRLRQFRAKDRPDQATGLRWPLTLRCGSREPFSCQVLRRQTRSIEGFRLSTWPAKGLRR